MIKQILLILLGIFFLLNGINHFYNTHILKEYAEKRGLFAPKTMVLLSGVILSAGGLSLITGFFVVYGLAGLSVFLIIASFTLHKFWEVRNREMMMMESMHFVKNWAILFELLYIASHLMGWEI
jgi:putative oxidoreductase